MTRTTAGVLLLLCISGRSFPSNADVYVRGVVADASGHKPLAGAVLIQEYPATGGVIVHDSAFSDSQGNFRVGLLDSNRFAHTLDVEKDDYKTQTLRVLPIDSQNILLDTVFMVRYTQIDSVKYVISGAVTDTGGEGIRGAIVSVTLSWGLSSILSFKDTASQWGGYYSVSTKQQYQPLPVAVRVQVQVPGFFPADVGQTLAASTQDFVINLVLKRNPASVLPVARKLTKATVAAAVTYTLDGRLLETGVHPGVHRFPTMVVVRVRPDGTGRADILLK